MTTNTNINYCYLLRLGFNKLINIHVFMTQLKTYDSP